MSVQLERPRERYDASAEERRNAALEQADRQSLKYTGDIDFPHAFNSKLYDNGGAVVNVKHPRYGAAGDGTTDDTDSLTAVLAAASPGSVVHLPAGTYYLSEPSFTVPNGVGVEGDGDSTVIYLDTSTDDEVLKCTGTGAVSGRALTANAAAGATSVSLSAPHAAEFAEGDYAIIGKDVAFGDSRVGEMVRVASVSGTTVNLEGHLIEAYPTADSSELVRLTMATPGPIRNLKIVNANPGTMTQGAIFIKYAVNPIVENVTVEGFDGPGVQLAHCAGGVVGPVRVRNLTDDEANSRFGYGINITGACQGTRVRGVYAEKCRHAFTTGNSTTPDYGVPRGITVSDGIAVGTTHYSWDTHEEGAGVAFTNCIAIGSQLGGFQTRAKNVSYTNCHAISCDVEGFTISGSSQGVTQHVGCTAVGTVTSGGQGSGFRAKGGSAAQYVGCEANGNGRHSWLIDDGAVQLVGCRAITNRSGGAGTGSIRLEADVDSAVIVGIDMDETGGHTQGIVVVSGADNVMVIGGRIAGVTTEISGVALVRGVIGTKDMGVVSNQRADFGADDATPSVSSGYYFRTANANATTITDFDDGVAGQEIVIEINDANTTVDFTSSGLKGNAGVDWSPTTGDHMRCVYNGSDWLCEVSDNTA